MDEKKPDFSFGEESKKPDFVFTPPQSTLPTSAEKSIKADDVGFFDPDHQDGTTGPVANAGKHIIYRDIYVFVDRLKDVANTKPHTYATVKAVITACRELALTWYTVELIEL